MFFSSVFTVEEPSDAPVFAQLTNSTIETIVVTEEMFKTKLGKIKEHGAPGPDNITPRLLKELQDVVATPICSIYNKSLSTGVVPEDWRVAHVTPVFKKGSRSLAENYRPISLTSIVCKILESMLCTAVTAHLNQYSLLKSSQHGFVTHRSCLTNLLQYFETLSNLLDQGHSVDAFYLDFSKAFDRVPHQRLLSKLKAHGITGPILTWIKSWLSGRKQKVVLNGSSSGWSSVSSGVPQGSVLGPCYSSFSSMTLIMLLTWYTASC